MWVSGNTMNTGAYLSFSIVQYCHVVDLINISKLGDTRVSSFQIESIVSYHIYCHVVDLINISNFGDTGVLSFGIIEYPLFLISLILKNKVENLSRIIVHIYFLV